MQSCDSTCSWCARDFWRWVASRMYSMARGGESSFAVAAIGSVRPRSQAGKAAVCNTASVGSTPTEVSTSSARKIKIATNLSDPPPLTPEIIAELDRQGREARDAYLKATADMERLTVEDLHRPIR